MAFTDRVYILSYDGVHDSGVQELSWNLDTVGSRSANLQPKA